MEHQSAGGQTDTWTGETVDLCPLVLQMWNIDSQISGAELRRLRKKKPLNLWRTPPDKKHMGYYFILLCGISSARNEEFSAVAKCFSILSDAPWTH